MIVHTMEQYSDEWWDIRKGVPTASCADKILTPTGKLSAQSRAYVNTLIADRLGLGDPPIEATEWMQRGLDLEPEARAFFELETGMETDQVGFVTGNGAGCSPDAFVADFIDRGGNQKYSTGLEIKCPKPSTHIGYLLGGELPAYYKPQVHFTMAVTGFNDYWFMSYHPELQPLLVQVVRDEYTAKVEAALREFNVKLSEARETLGL